MSAGQRATGLPCPECGVFIPMSLAQLLSEPGFRCAACGLELTLDRSRSAPSLVALERVRQAIADAEAVRDRYR